MRLLILRISVVLIWINTTNLRVSAQSNSTGIADLFEITDTCLTNEIKKDTIFYPDSLHQKYVDQGWMFEYSQPPEFPGGEKALIEYFKNNIIYPEQAVKDKIEGMALIRFTITPEGCIGKLGFMKKVSPDIDNEVIRVVKILPRFKPATINTKSDKGWYWKPVTIWYMVSLNFTLSDDLNKRGIIIKPKN